MRPERNIPHLELRASGYFWRRRLPKQVFSKDMSEFGFDPTTVLFSLRTNDPVEAVPLARRLTQLSSLTFTLARSAKMTPSETHALVTETLRREIAAADAARAVAPPRSREDAILDQAQLATLVATLREAIELRDYGLVHGLLRGTAQDLGIAADETGLAWRSAAHQTVRGLLDATRERMAHDRGEFDEPSHFFRSARNQARAVAEATGLQPRTISAPASFASQGTLAADAPGFPVQKASAAASFASTNAQVTSHTGNRTAECPPASTSILTTPDETADPGLPAEKDHPDQAPDPLAAGAAASDRCVTPTQELAFREPAKAAALPPAQETIRVSETSLMVATASADQVPSPSTAVPPLAVLATFRPAGPLLSQVSEKYLAHIKAGFPCNRPAENQVATGEKTDKQMENPRATMRLVLAVLRDQPIEAMTQEVCSTFFNKICRLPNTFCRSEAKMAQLESGERTIDAFIEDADTLERDEKQKLEARLKKQGVSKGNIKDALTEVHVERLHANTVYRKMQELQRFFEFALVERHLLTNPMKYVIWTTTQLDAKMMTEGDLTRLVWGDDLPKLLRTPRFTTKLDDVGDPLFWAVIIAIFTGMRLEEILQLRVGDFLTDREVDFINVTDTFGRRLKNKAARRRIPIHSSLVRFGLLQLVEIRRQAGEAYLFPDLEAGKRGTVGAKISSDFTEYRREHELYFKRKDFHSFRKSVNQRMIELNVSAELRYALLGHTNNAINMKHYSDGFPIELLRDAIETIDFDISMVRRPFAPDPASNVTRIASFQQRHA